MAIKLTAHLDPSSPTKMCVAAHFDNYLEGVAHLIETEVVKQIAARYVEENYAQLVAKLDQVAIANLAIAVEGQAVAKEIGEHPIVVSHHAHTTNHHKRSIF